MPAERPPGKEVGALDQNRKDGGGLPAPTLPRWSTNGFERRINVTMCKGDIEQARELFGAAPVLTSEEPERFERFFVQLATSIKPGDFTELLLIWHFACESWSLSRHARHAAIAIERSYKAHLFFHEQRAKLAEKRRLAGPGSTFANSVPSDIAALANLEARFLSTDEEVKEILERTASERDHNFGLQKSIVLQEQLDKLLNSATRRRDDALSQLELYRIGLGAQAKEVAGQILDGEFEEAAPATSKAPALAPPDEVTIDDD